MTNQTFRMDHVNFNVIFFLILIAIRHSVADIDYERIYLQDYCDGHTTVFQVNNTSPFGFIFDSINQYYTPGKTCKIRLEAYPPNHRITTRFLFIDIFTQSGQSCTEDKLNVAGETNNRNYCGRWKPAESLYSSANYLNFTFTTTYLSPPNAFTGFKISYTKFHTGECMTDEFQCWYDDRCIPTDLRCDGVDNCGDFSDERYCSTISTVGSVILTTSIVISLVVMLSVVCACMVKVLISKKNRRRNSSTSTPPIPQSYLDQTAANQTHPLSNFPPPQAQPGSVNPYNEPPPSYYYVHFTSGDKVEEGGSSGGEGEPTVRVLTIPTPASNVNNMEGGNTILPPPPSPPITTSTSGVIYFVGSARNHPIPTPTSAGLPPYETYRDECVVDPRLLQQLQHQQSHIHQPQHQQQQLTENNMSQNISTVTNPNDNTNTIINNNNICNNIGSHNISNNLNNISNISSNSNNNNNNNSGNIDNNNVNFTETDSPNNSSIDTNANSVHANQINDSNDLNATNIDTNIVDTVNVTGVSNDGYLNEE